ncbi:MAG TPA: VWA domain-containing protein [Blastocatellia bacterium]|nr:VWA domain-containing protein [Blastocatellia bacterium]
MKRKKGKEQGANVSPAAILLLPPIIHRRFARALLRILLPLAFCLLPFALSSAQSGRQTQPPPRPSSVSQHEGQKPAPPSQDARPPQDTRPRRVADEDQDDSPIKLSASLVTVITSVTDAAGNQINDLAQNDFEIYEDNAPQDIAGFYREGQMPLRLIFLFDTSSSIRHRFDFEQRAAAQFFRQVMRPGDQGAIMSVSTDPKLEAQFTSDVDKLVNTLANMKPEGATSLYNAMIEAAKYIRPAEGRHVMVVLSDGTDTSSSATLAQALTEVQRSDAIIYAVHSTGIAPSANVQDLAGEFVLKAMCEDTGGRAFFPPIYQEQKKEIRDLDEIYKRVTAEVRAQFVLTYYSKGGGKPNTFKAVRVAVKRPGLQVRARRGYYTSK